MDNFSPKFKFNKIDSSAVNLIVCPDQYVANYILSNDQNQILQRVNENIKYSRKFFQNKCSNVKENTIVVILESPHTSEYEYNNGVFTPIGPLCGKWNNFSSFFDLSIKTSSVNSLLRTNITYNIALVNAVQYQCSLGKSLSGKNSYQNQKNYNVISCWFKGFNVDLIKRLEALNPQIIINLSGKDETIRILVEKAILNSKRLKNIPYTYGMHPSYWNVNKNKKLIE